MARKNKPSSRPSSPIKPQVGQGGSAPIIFQATSGPHAPSVVCKEKSKGIERRVYKSGNPSRSQGNSKLQGTPPRPPLSNRPAFSYRTSEQLVCNALDGFSIPTHQVTSVARTALLAQDPAIIHAISDSDSLRLPDDPEGVTTTLFHIEQRSHV